MADGLAVEFNGEFAVVLGEDRRAGRGGILFLVSDPGNSERKDQSHAQGESEAWPSPGNFPCHGIPLRSGLRNAAQNYGEEISEDYSNEGQSGIWFFDDKMCFAATC